MPVQSSVWNPWSAMGQGSPWTASQGQVQQALAAAARQQAGASTPGLATPAYSWLPWGTQWGQTPWAGVPTEKAQQQMAWMNVALPWMQAAMQGQQWGTEFDWRRAMDEWQKQFQEQQFGWQKGQDIWGQQFQEQQLGQQKALEEARQAAEKEMTTMQTFGRRWRPQTRWM